MGWRRSEIEVYHCIDLSDYDDEIMQYMEPDNIFEAMEMMDRWGYSDGDIIAHMLEEPSAFLEKVASTLTVETALALVKDVYEHGREVTKSNLIAKDNQITELTLKIDELLALNHTIIKEGNDDTPNV